MRKSTHLFRSNSKIKGVTLVEAMIAVAILAILASLAVPSMKTAIINARISGQVNDLVGSLNSAARAKKNGALCKSSDGVTCSTAGADWAIGWIEFVDLNVNGVVDPGEEVVRVYPALAGNSTAIASNSLATGLSFSRPGGLPGATFTGASIAVCPPAVDGASYCKYICVNSQGRPRVDTSTEFTTDAICGN